MKRDRWLSTMMLMSCVAVGANHAILPAFGQVSSPSPGIESYWIDGNGTNVVWGTGELADVTVGSALIRKGAGSRSITGTAIFRLRQNGVLISETGVPAVAAARSGRLYAEVNGPINTGVAIANPNEQDAVVSFYFTNQDGSDFGHGIATVPAKHQISRFLNESPFNITSTINATLTFTSNLPIGVTALRGVTNERKEFLMTTLPVAPVGATDGQVTYLPHFAVGGGWSTEVILINPTDQPVGGTVQFMSAGTVDAAAQPAEMTIDSRTASSFEYVVPGRSFRKLRPASLASTTATGSVVVMPAAGHSAPSTVAIFSFQNGGIRVTEAGFSGVRPASTFRLYADHAPIDDEGAFQTGIAVSNPSTEPVVVRFELSNFRGALSLTGSKTIPGRGQIALFTNQIPGFESIPELRTAILRVSTSSSAGISVIGLRGRSNARGDFLITTTPAVDESKGDPQGVMLFPLIVEGGGYVTEIGLYAARPGPVAFGTLHLSKQAGDLFFMPSLRTVRGNQNTAIVHHFTFDSGAANSVLRQHCALLEGASVRNGILELNGTTAYVQCGNQLVATNASYTVAMFVRHRSLQPRYVEWISQGMSGGPPFYFGHDPNRNLRATDQWQQTGVPAAPADGRFHHYALVVDMTIGQSRIYVDGTLRATLNTALRSGLQGTFTRFGRQFGDDGVEYHAGDLDDIRIMVGVLTDSEIAALAVADPTWPQ